MKKILFSVLGIALIGALILGVSCKRDDDINPPLIKNVKVESVGTEVLVFKADVVDDLGVKSVELFYKLEGTTDFTAKEMTKGEGDTYAVEVSGFGPEMVILYYLKAVNTSNMETLEPKDAPNNTLKHEIGGINYAGVVINEIWAGGPTDEHKFIELYNKTNEPIDISDVYFERNDEGEIGRIPEGTVLGGGKYYILGTKSNINNPVNPEEPYDHFVTKGFSAKKSIRFIMFSPLGNEMDRFLRGSEDNLDAGISDLAPGSYSRIPNGTGEWKIVDNATLRAENDPTGAANIPNE